MMTTRCNRSSKPCSVIHDKLATLTKRSTPHSRQREHQCPSQCSLVRSTTATRRSLIQQTNRWGLPTSTLTTIRSMTPRWHIKTSQPQRSKPESTQPKKEECFQVQPKNVRRARAWTTRSWPNNPHPSSAETTEHKPTPPSEAKATSPSFHENPAGAPWVTCRRVRRKVEVSIHEVSVSSKWTNIISSRPSRRSKEAAEKMKIQLPIESEICRRKEDSRNLNPPRSTWRRIRNFRLLRLKQMAWATTRFDKLIESHVFWIMKS